MKTKCNICEKEFTSERSCKRHIKGQHPEVYINDNITYFYTEEETLSLPFLCETCGFRTNRKESLSRHINGSHVKKTTRDSVNCPLCGKDTTKAVLRRHLRSEHNLTDKELFVTTYKTLNPGNIPTELAEYYYDRIYTSKEEPYTKQINSFVENMKEIRALTFEDIDRFIEKVLPFKLKNPKIGNCKELAYLMGKDEKEGDIFYQKMKNSNPFTGHGSELSPFSEKFIGYENLSDEEKEKRIKDSKQYERDDRSQSQYKYWMKKGLSESDAKLKVSKIQKRFSKEKCIEQYGEEEGLKRWKERQEKWMDTISTPEIQTKMQEGRIKGLKGNDKTYSKISQDLFDHIYSRIKDEFKHIYYATRGTEKKNNEYVVRFDGSHAFLDFYIEDVKKCIEFDGDYWHGSKGNVKRDLIREEKIKNAIPDIKIFHVKESDYRKDREKVVDECIKFLKD